MSVVLLLATAMLVAAAILLTIRATIGPTILDRSVALDVLVAVTVCGIGLHVASTGKTVALPIVLVLAGFGFVGAASVARYASRSDDLEAGRDGAEEMPGDRR